jgi:CDP-ribitol ribitolphosphotransferase / teichoic acid ribitol-phosphate polymerase
LNPQTRVPSAAEAADVDLLGVSWERIQITFRLRARGGRRLDPASVRLAWVHDPSVTMPPTRGALDGDDLVLRFNVMQGPGQMPLDPGTWKVVLASGETPRGLPLRVVEGTRELEGRAGRFATGRGEYAAIPAIAPGDGSLVIRVSIDPSTAETLPLRTRFIRRLTRNLLRASLQLLFDVCRPVARRNGRRILFVSYMGTELSGNMKAVWDRMVERGLDRQYELRKLTRQRLEGRSYGYLLRMPWMLARADTIVIDAQNGALDRIRGLDAGMVILWHAATTIKTIGYSRIGRPRSLDPWSLTYKTLTYAIANGDHDVPIFAEAFGIPEERVVPTGHPRLDRFFDEAYRARAVQSTLEDFPEARGRMVILFAPTWRYAAADWRNPGTGPAGRTYDLSVLDYARLYDVCVEKDAVFIIRLHPSVSRPLGIPTAYRDRILDGSTTVMDAPDLLFVTDLLITDYSSIVLEYSIQRRPVLLFPYDLAEYQADRDVYAPYEEFAPGRIVLTFDALLDAIRRDDYQVERVAPFAERHFAHFDTGATDRVVDLILGARPAPGPRR